MMTRTTEIEEHLTIAVETIAENKGVDVVTLDLRKVSDATDFFAIASGTSDTHVRALANKVTDALTALGRKPHHVEGLSTGRWVLLDYVDFVIHIFHPTLRDFYQLERLWADAPTQVTPTPRTA